MAIQLNDDGQRCAVELEGEIGIAEATELKTALVAAISSGKAVRVDLERATGFDATALQLFWAAARQAKKNRTGFELGGPNAETLTQLAREIGFADLAVDKILQAVSEPAPAFAAQSANDR